MIKRRLFTMLLLLSMVFMLSACGNDTISTSELTEPQESVATDLVYEEKSEDIQEEVPAEQSENADAAEEVEELPEDSDVETNTSIEEDDATPLAPVVSEIQEEEQEQAETQEATHSYIANKNSKKLHYTGCESVGKMKESNKVYLDCTRSEALERGYTPCKNCNP